VIGVGSKVKVKTDARFKGKTGIVQVSVRNGEEQDWMVKMDDGQQLKQFSPQNLLPLGTGIDTAISSKFLMIIPGHNGNWPERKVRKHTEYFIGLTEDEELMAKLEEQIAKLKTAMDKPLGPVRGNTYRTAFNIYKTLVGMPKFQNDERAQELKTEFDRFQIQVRNRENKKIRAKFSRRTRVQISDRSPKYGGKFGTVIRFSKWTDDGTNPFPYIVRFDDKELRYGTEKTTCQFKAKDLTRTKYQFTAGGTFRKGAPVKSTTTSGSNGKFSNGLKYGKHWKGTVVGSRTQRVTRQMRGSITRVRVRWNSEYKEKITNANERRIQWVNIDNLEINEG